MSANVFLNPDKKVVCSVDPITQKVVSESAGSGLASGEVEEYRSAISGQLKEYLAAFYEDGSSNPTSVSRGTGAVYASTSGQIAIVISFKNLNFGNFWTGGWQSEWNFSVSSKGTTKLEGRIRLNAHFFEDGNVQLNSTFTENGEVDISDAATTAERVINTITTLENDFQLRLDKFYVQMHDSTFKNMRRYVSRTFFEITLPIFVVNFRKNSHFFLLFLISVCLFSV